MYNRFREHWQVDNKNLQLEYRVKSLKYLLGLSYFHNGHLRTFKSELIAMIAL